ncbi:hypothetical protein AQI95_37805 [Streptomyces yokosukanensis]|uniref:Uncharacterized protein n=1 Tax=Streptomyces yokosukanensis TaxID=67386 RepID=A0A101NUQ4_9ACTN|nr:hypothetical protein AQI95_37805 [Streptomyces yokosukanensis]
MVRGRGTAHEEGAAACGGEGESLLEGAGRRSRTAGDGRRPAPAGEDRAQDEVRSATGCSTAAASTAPCRSAPKGSANGISAGSTERVGSAASNAATASSIRP